MVNIRLFAADFGRFGRLQRSFARLKPMRALTLGKRCNVLGAPFKELIRSTGHRNVASPFIVSGPAGRNQSGEHPMNQNNPSRPARGKVLAARRLTLLASVAGLGVAVLFGG